ncbi:hypothetical protein GCM10010116_32800 [Microbispora rosea subsp. aerata]|nr:hypothetical protein GCM10010116_32800 [Microbispora rosea subsp. aerata]GIH55883.1 hypothetical protein Mro02_27970 [Microbispora rosea subsp. aerata]GLJ83203.1 hypothetical protein GCM10017588_19300 [Microbispora rosea subsp. aerata]
MRRGPTHCEPARHEPPSEGPSARARPLERARHKPPVMSALAIGQPAVNRPRGSAVSPYAYVAGGPGAGWGGVASKATYGLLTLPPGEREHVSALLARLPYDMTAVRNARDVRAWPSCPRG